MMEASRLQNEQSVQTGKSQAWLKSAGWDLSFIIGPAFVSSFVALAFRDQFENMASLPTWAWVCFVLLIDVAHVYASLFRTYFDKRALEKNGTLLLTIPIACWVVGAMLYSLSALMFWRCLAYLAVFHFIRQQYGFMAIYSRKDSEAYKHFKILDEILIYLATLYPLLYWHTNLPRNFNWFVEGDFVESFPAMMADLGLALYILAAVIYAAKEIYLYWKTRNFNLPKNLLLLGTAFSWWVAIVAINSDMSFTMVNVISHGVPYMALVWLYHNAKQNQYFREQTERSENSAAAPANRALKLLLSYVPAFLCFLFLLAYLEEGLWAGLVWREHLSLFKPFSLLPALTDGGILALLIPLLSLPQSTHYVLDGFIWRVKDRASVWSA